MKTRQSIPDEVSSILYQNQKRLAELNALDQWTETNFEEIMRCSSEWSSDLRAWIFPLSAIERLAFDTRTPDSQALSLQLIAKQMQLNARNT